MMKTTALAALLALAGVAAQAVASEPMRRTQANVMIELRFAAAGTYQDPSNDVTLDVVFTDPNGKAFRVPAFWAGGTTWKVRYASPIVGTHRFRSECSIAQDKGLHAVTGHLEIEPYTGENPLYVHGPLRVAASKRYLERGDGTPFFWLGDTWWMGLSHRLRWPEDVTTLAADRKKKGFNVIQIVAGLYPDMHPFDPRGANEAGFPWEENYAAIRPEYFDAADERIFYLVDQGFTPCIVGAWGYFMQWMGPDKAKQHWRNLIARYGALPVAWCAAGEANLSWYLAEGFPYDDRKQVTGWTEVLRFIRATDPFRRPLTIHPTGLGRWSSRHCTNDEALLDFDMLQTPHGQGEAVPLTLSTMRASYADTPIMPVINGEAAYEMLHDSLPTKWTRRMFWLCVTNGAAGHTYGANGIWQVNRRGQPHGPSPHHPPDSHGYGRIPWDEAMNLPGSRQVAFGKALMEQYPWHEFQPHPEWAEYAGASSAANFDGAQWIWFPEGDPAQDAPAERRFLRKQFLIPAGKTVASACLSATADDAVSVRLNGVTLGASTDWKNVGQFDAALPLRTGPNALAMVVENTKPEVATNPAGMLCALEVRFADGDSLRVVSDASWRCAKREQERWEHPDFDEAAWSPAVAMGGYGSAPWGDFLGAAANAARDRDCRCRSHPLRPARGGNRTAPSPRRCGLLGGLLRSGQRREDADRRSSQQRTGRVDLPATPAVKEDDWIVILQVE